MLCLQIGETTRNQSGYFVVLELSANFKNFIILRFFYGRRHIYEYNRRGESLSEGCMKAIRCKHFGWEIERASLSSHLHSVCTQNEPFLKCRCQGKQNRNQTSHKNCQSDFSESAHNVEKSIIPSISCVYLLMDLFSGFTHSVAQVTLMFNIFQCLISLMVKVFLHSTVVSHY
jgi:hypothetical protein